MAHPAGAGSVWVMQGGIIPLEAHQLWEIMCVLVEGTSVIVKHTNKMGMCMRTSTFRDGNY